MKEPDSGRDFYLKKFHNSIRLYFWSQTGKGRVEKKVGVISDETKSVEILIKVLFYILTN
jgi:hypothetical protein